jgi:Putative Flp pilus-assembly TadE/G-like
VVQRVQRVAVTPARFLRKCARSVEGCDERGAVAVIMAIMLTLMLAITALVVDLGNARQQRREAQNSADAAVLAGAETIEAGNGTINWTAVVDQVKKYAQVNDGVATSAWMGCTDTNALAYKPDSSNANSCISADLSAWPAVGAGSVGTTDNRLRVKLPNSSVKSFFAGVVGVNSLTVGAAATTKTAMTVQQITVSESVAGGPCALCILGQGLTLDGQNGDVAVTGGNVIVNSTAGTAASLNPNGHVQISTSGGTIGGPNAPGNFSGSGFSPSPTRQDPVPDPLAALPQCGNGSACPTTNGSNGTTNGATLSPGIYSTISKSHALNPGIYVITGGITLSGNDLLQGDGVLLYFACSGYPAACAPYETGAGITATGNGALRITAITQAQCTTNATYCPYVGMMDFADRNNYATQTWRGNGTNENGSNSGISGTIYMKSGEMDLRGNGFQMASQIVVDRFTMKGNPSTVTLSYDQSKNYSESHTETSTSYSASYDNNGLSG